MLIKTALNYTTAAAEATVVKQPTRWITGTSLGHWVPHLNAAQRGIIGGALFAGDLGLVQPTLEMSAHAARSNTRYAWGASRLNPGERFLVWENARPLIEPKPKHVATPASDDEALVAIAGRRGINHCLDVLAQADVAIAVAA
jgi:hypothetical protein